MTTENAAAVNDVKVRDVDLFTQPNSSCYGDCPICCLPLSLNRSNQRMTGCCSKLICTGCDVASAMREIEAGLELRCPFCRHPTPESRAEADRDGMERVKKDCPAALFYEGKKSHNKGDYAAALQYWTKAAELGDALAHFELSDMYREGNGVEEDSEKEVYHLKEAAIRGDPNSRLRLGYMDAINGRFDRAKKHFIINANLGEDDSIYNLRIFYADGHASKQEYDDALRAYQAAVDATKSQQREEGEAYFKANEALYARS